MASSKLKVCMRWTNVLDSPLLHWQHNQNVKVVSELDRRIFKFALRILVINDIMVIIEKKLRHIDKITFITIHWLNLFTFYSDDP